MKLYQNDDGTFNFGSRPSDQGSTYVDSAYSGSDYVGLMAQQAANKTNIQLAKENNDFNERMWNLNNQYNTPSAQVQRLIDAGINPSSQYGNYSNASQGQVEGTLAQVQAGQYDPNVATNRFNSRVGLAKNVLDSLNDVFSSAIDTKRLGLEYDRLSSEIDVNNANIGQINANTRYLNQNTKFNKAQTEGQKLSNNAQRFQNEHQEETYQNAQDLVKAQIETAYKAGDLTDAQRKQVEETTRWIPTLNNAQLSQISATIGQIKATTAGIWSENAVKDLYKRLADSDIDPHASYMDEFFKLAMHDPEKFGPILDNIINAFVHTGKTVSRNSNVRSGLEAAVKNATSAVLGPASNLVFRLLHSNSNSHSNRW